MTDAAGPPQGWHADPMGRFAQRWWDGARWTEHVSNLTGSSAIDPVPVGTAPVVTQHSAAAFQHPMNPHSPQLAMPVQTPGYGLPGGGAWAAPQQIAIANVSKSPGLAIAAMVLGVGAFFFSLIPFFGFLSIPFAICGIALGITGISRANKGYEGRGMAITGVLASAAALLVSFVYIFAIGESVDELNDGVNTDPIDGICNPDRFLQDPDC